MGGAERERAGRKKMISICIVWSLFGMGYSSQHNLLRMCIYLSILLGTWRIMGQQMSYCRRLSVKIHIVLELKPHMAF